MRIGPIVRCLLTLTVGAAVYSVAPSTQGSTVRPGAGAEQQPAPRTDPVSAAIDRLIWDSAGPTERAARTLCDDPTFIRRVSLDVIGRLPKAGEVEAFVNDPAPDKRTRLIDRLLADDAYADFWALRWADLLRIKSEHPINLWPNAVQTYHRWLHHSLAQNKPYDRFVRELLTASGSNFREPPVNFYRAVQGRKPPAIAADVALTFMGSRVDAWPDNRRAELEAFFSRLVFKPTAEWKEEIVLNDPAPRPPMNATLPDGGRARIGPTDDPRVAFADWLVRADNPAFTAPIANRLWAWLMGRGIVHEADDFRPDNPPSHPALLELLQRELVRSRFDLKHLTRVILNTHTYQQACATLPGDDRPERGYARYRVRQIEAEVLADALNDLFGQTDRYESPIPEPFTYVPEHQRAVTLADASITSPFLELFGRPPRDTGLQSERSAEPTDAQRMYLLNSSHIQNKIERSWRLQRLVHDTRSDDDRLIAGLYLSILSRRPSLAELSAARAYLTLSDLTRQQAAIDLAWSLINTKEFVCRH